MTSEERHTESVRRLAAIETKLDGLVEGQKAMDQRLTGVERKINYFSGGVAVVAGLLGLFLDKLRGLFG